MELTNIHLINFRGFRNAEIKLDKITAFVGTNSSGKSTILQAIQMLIEVKQKFTENDFHLHREDYVEIEGSFILTDKEREEVSSYFGIQLETFRIRKFRKRENGSTIYQIAFPDYGDPKLNPKHVNSSTVKEYREAAKKGSLPEEFSKLNSVSATKEALKRYLLETTSLKSKDIIWEDVKGGEIERFLPDSLYIPAFENIEKHTEYAKTNFFGMILRNVFEKLENNPDYKRFKIQYENLTKKIFSPDANRRVKDIVDFEDNLTGYIQEILPTKVTLNFSVPEISDFLLKNFAIHLDDGVKTPVTGKGHGAQRAIIWALLRYYLDHLKSEGKKSTIFLVEEPELYLHPQAQRVMLKTLKELAERGQVLYSTHSPVFVDLEHPESIRVIRKQNKEAMIYTLPPIGENEKEQVRYLKWMGDAHNEIFFAKSVILYEGATEKLLLTHMNKNPIRNVGDENINRKISKTMNFDELGCQMITTGGKFAMPFFTRLLMHAKIPFYVIYDHDSSSDFHSEINDHIKRNIRNARNSGMIAESTVHYPFLEKEWGIQTSEKGKVDTLYQFLKDNPNNWSEKMVMKYNALRRRLYKFAWQAYLPS